jgi:hypothetical protein
MADQHVASLPRIPRWKDWQRDGAVAALVALAVVAVDALKGFPMLADWHGDNDNLMRMVEVLDLLSGQGWYDLHQYRMGLPGGFLMHWSRFVDAPIAAIVLAGKALTGSIDAGATAAAILWPAALFAAGLFFLMRLVRAFAEPAALFPAAVIGALALYAVAIFQPGALDHHNAQLVLTLATVAGLFAAPSRPLAAAGAGIAASLMLVVGMETVAYVALAGTVTAAGFLVNGLGERRAAAAFGLGFAGVSLLAFLATVPAALWGAPACDAFTIPQMSVAVIAGSGLAAIALLPATNSTFGRRLAALALLGLVLGAFVVAVFPQCLADPYAGVDPRLRTYWLDAVAEAQSFPSLLRSAPFLVATYYVTPLIGLAALVARMRARGFDRRLAVVGAFLAMAVLVSLWQVRGSFFSIPLAVVPLALWVGRWRERAERGSPAIVVGMVGAWLVSFNIAWSAAAGAAAGMRADGAAVPASAPDMACYAAGDYARLAGLPRGTVLTVSNLGSAVLRYTPHRVLAGPYHRNVAGDIATLDALMGDERRAEDIVRRQGVTIVALCPGNDETAALAADAPGGLIAALVAGRVPGWLRPVPSRPGEPLRLFRVVPE